MIKITTQYIWMELSTLIVFKTVYDNGADGHGFFLKIEDLDRLKFVEELTKLLSALTVKEATNIPKDLI